MIIMEIKERSIVRTNKKQNFIETTEEAQFDRESKREKHNFIVRVEGRSTISK